MWATPSSSAFGLASQHNGRVTRLRHTRTLDFMHSRDCEEVLRHQISIPSGWWYFIDALGLATCNGRFGRDTVKNAPINLLVQRIRAYGSIHSSIYASAYRVSQLHG